MFTRDLYLHPHPRPLPASHDPRRTLTTVALGHWGGVLMFLFCFVVFLAVIIYACAHLYHTDCGV